MVEALREYNSKKFKCYETLKFLEKSSGNSNFISELPEELFSDSELNNAVEILKTLASSHFKRDEVEKVIEEIVDLERQKANVGKSLDQRLAKSLERFDVDFGEKELEDNLQNKENLYWHMKQIT
jgi:Glu-tRNA(Gln) amidotransferase subunit E-like FAD-binding protein